VHMSSCRYRESTALCSSGGQMARSVRWPYLQAAQALAGHGNSCVEPRGAAVSIAVDTAECSAVHFLWLCERCGCLGIHWSR
jgi:hypothetical protein